MIFHTIFSIPTVLVWGLWTDEVILWFGFDEETAAFAQSFVYPYLAWYVVGGIDACIYSFLAANGHEQYATIFEIGYTATKTLIYVVMVAIGIRDLLAIQIVTAIWGIIAAVANFGFVMYRGWLDEYWEGLAMTFSLKVSSHHEVFLVRSSSGETDARVVLLTKWRFPGSTGSPHHDDYGNTTYDFIHSNIWRGKRSAKHEPTI